MAFAADHPGTVPLASGVARGWLVSATGWLGLAAVASLGAGAVHAAAAGTHADNRPAAVVFLAVATLQLAWGGLGLVRASAVAAGLGLAVNLGAVAGWVAAKTVGIPFVAGLDAAEPIEAADAAAAALAAVAAVAAILAALAWQRSSVERDLHRAMTVPAAVLLGLAVFGMFASATHDGGHGHPGGSESAGADAAQPAPAVPPVPYDPAKPIDLGGVDGVTPAQQAAAENLVAITVVRLPKWSDPAVAEAAGYRSIGDGALGHEHFVNQSFMDDGITLDPDRPESLVYDTKGGGRRLVAAMYMMQRGLPLEDVPDIGGKLMQWHTHENLCYNAEGRVAGLTDAAGNCRAGLVKPVPTPMIHVWIEPHRCGPFAALEGIAGGRIPDGEAVLCDHAHGAR